MSMKKDANDLQEEKEQLSRRDFIKATGVTAGIAGVAAVGSATPALATERDNGSVIMDLAVNEVDRPPYMDYPFEFNDAKFERIGENFNAFGSREFAKQELGGVPWIKVYTETRRELAREDRPGYTLLDKSLCDAAEISKMVAGKVLKSWSPLGIADIELGQELKGRYSNPEDNNRYVKKAAHFFGAGDCGVAAVNEKWFFSTATEFEKAKNRTKTTRSVPIIFSDEHDVPTVTNEARYIPKTMNRVIAMIIPMEGEVAKYTPTRLADAVSTLAYSKKTELSSKLAEFIRGLGYNAIPMGNDTSLSIPIAIDAGMGELGRHGLLIHPKYGSLCKVTKVLTDMPIAVDKPINFGAAEFCRSCMKCADTCPSESISKDTDPSYEVQCPSNNPGVKKWYVNTWSCLKYWSTQNGVCMNCITVCPYSKPQTWIHDVVKGVSSKTALFNSTFRLLDDVLGYGKTSAENDPNEWWARDEYGIEWLKL